VASLHQVLEQYDCNTWPDIMIRVASYNIRKSIGLDRKRNPERILDVLNEINADVVFLQEADKRIGKRASSISHELLKSQSPYKAVDIAIREHSIGWHGNAILVREGMKIQRSWRIDLPTYEQRGAVAADIQISGICVRFVATHLGLLPQIRRRQVKRILSALRTEPDKLPTIIGGDFNEWRKSGGCIDIFGEEYKPNYPQHSFHSAFPVVALDRIIVSKNIDFQKSEAHRSEKSRIASDHLPIWADLNLPNLV
jgi:endonuclease/exonuclease/phosphatase family metal-dependent hydrolase